MNEADMPQSLMPLVPHVVPFLLELFRISGIFLLAPVFGSNAVPVRIKALLAVVLAFSVYPLISQVQAVEWSTVALGLALTGMMLVLVAEPLAELIGQALSSLSRLFEPAGT